MINRAFGLDSRLCDDGYLLNQVPDDIAESDPNAMILKRELTEALEE
jgi:hypothetical protein